MILCYYLRILKYLLILFLTPFQELEVINEELQRRMDEALSALQISERKRVTLQTEVEDLRSALENVSEPLSGIVICELKKL